MEKLRFKDENGNNYPQWEICKLNEIAKIFDGTHQTPQYKESGIPFYSVTNVTNNNFKNTKYISEDIFYKEKIKISYGDILMSKIGDVGTTKYIDWDIQASFYVSLALIKIEEKLTNSQFINYQINSGFFKNELRKRTLIKAFPQKINLSEIGKCLIYKSNNIDEQNKIANYFYNLDTVINNKQRQLELMGKYKEDLLDKIFNQKIRFKDENGDNYPEWKKAKLGDYITIFPKSKHPASVGLISGKYNFFTTSNKNLYLNEFDIDGDYLIIGDGGVANFKHYNGKFSISDHCWLAKFENLNNNYVKQFLTYKEKLINDLLFQGTGLRNLSRKLFLNFEFPLIDIKEQEKIANLFSNLDLKINVLKNSIKNLKEYKINMLEKMF